MTDLHQQIADLEAEIESLSETAERVRKTIVAAKGAVAGGGLLLLVLLLGVLRFEPLAFVVGIAAILGGIALYGSNRSTLDEITATIRSHEARRAAMIDALQPLSVGDDYRIG